MKKLLLVGNANCGKTTLFNTLTNSFEHVGNWHGVTIAEKKKEFVFDGNDFLLFDIPGIYSLNAFSFEEQVAIDAILKNKEEKILNLCDKNNLQRNLYLTLCLLENGFDTTILINNIDKKNIYKIDTKKLSKMLNVDVFEIDAKEKENLKNFLKNTKNCFRNAILPYKNNDFLQKSIKEQAKIRYDYIDFLIKNCTTKTNEIYGKSKIDKFVLNRFFAIPIFFAIMILIFYLTFFSFGKLLSNGLSNLLSLVSSSVVSWLKGGVPPWLASFFETAIFGGINIVISFLPQVVIMFLALSILEDSGYMSRVAFVFDDLLCKVGLSGKSVYSLLMGFGCSTTAIMTARTMDEKSAKIKTALACPYMSCSAKIPIYAVVGGAVFGANNLWVIFGLYLLGVVVSVCVSSILNKTILKGKKQNFILEFPPYRKMSAKRVLLVLWKNTKDFLLKIGSVMLATNVIVWFVSSFSLGFSYVGENGASMLQSLGKIVAPIFVPLGFGSWAIACSLLAGFVAKEVVVSSIAMFNKINSNSQKLISKSILMPSSVVFFASKASVLSFLVFCLLYTPCLSSVIMLSKEVGKKWAFFAVLTQFFVAYVLSFFVYNLAFATEVFGAKKVFVFALFAGVVLLSIYIIYRHIKNRKCGGRCDDCKRGCGKI